jgi:hypothetical protein
MRAICHAGCPAEALATYHESDLLLGAEPSQELRWLHADVLAGHGDPGARRETTCCRPAWSACTTCLPQTLVVLTGATNAGQDMCPLL